MVWCAGYCGNWGVFEVEPVLWDARVRVKLRDSVPWCIVWRFWNVFFSLTCKYNVCTVSAGWKTKILKQTCALMFMPLFLSGRAKLGHGLLSGQYSKPPMKSELIEQVMKEEYKVLNWVCPAPKTGSITDRRMLILSGSQSFSTKWLYSL